MKRPIFLHLSIIFIFCFICNTAISSPNDSCKIRISVLTCSPGDELYSLFGHSALRITDSARGTDVIYNWGTFDFNEPNFYLKFVRGKLLYFLSPDNVRIFLMQYQDEGRGVIEQVLSLNCEEKLQIQRAVDINMEGDNVYYKYDFLFDNCTTRIRDIIFKNVDHVEVKNQLVPEGTTFRNLIHSYLDSGNHPWSKLGIDILLGSIIDRSVTNYESMFLPDYLMKGISSSTVANTPIVQNEKSLLPFTSENVSDNKYSPLIILSIVCILIFLISLIPNKFAKSFTKFTDSFLIYITGVLGLFLIFMWFFTDHISCSNNFNLLWAMPLNIIAGFMVFKKPTWIKRYFLIMAGITFLNLVLWKILPQEFNLALIPVLILLFYRYLRLGLSKE